MASRQSNSPSKVLKSNANRSTGLLIKSRLNFHIFVSSFSPILPPPHIRIQPPLPRWGQHQRRLKTANKSKLWLPLSLKHPRVLFFLSSPLPKTREIHDFPIPPFPYITDLDRRWGSFVENSFDPIELCLRMYSDLL